MRWVILIALGACGGSQAAPIVANEAPAAPDAAVAEVTLPGDAARGAKTFEAKGCISCHSIDGTARVGVTMKGLWDSDVVMSDGRQFRVNAELITEALLEPQLYVQAGFPSGTMPSYEGLLTDDEVDDLIAYIATLK